MVGTTRTAPPSLPPSPENLSSLTIFPPRFESPLVRSIERRGENQCGLVRLDLKLSAYERLGQGEVG